MKQKFNWYLTPNEVEFNQIWQTGLLTPDANVLLDLYRYHEDTRTALLEAIESFHGRVWITHQAAEEFFRNRKRVIASASASYNEAEKELAAIRKNSEESMKAIRANRIIPDLVSEELEKEFEAAMEKAQTNIVEARSTHVDYFEKDPILEKLLEIFDGAVGNAFEANELDEQTKEAKRRVESKIPPGYYDAKKDGAHPYGDYFMWRQMLNHAKKSEKPLIFVTSETKEDWWEKASGKTLGPQYQLQKEAFEQSGQRIIFYRTDRFLQFSNQKRGKEQNESAVEEIRSVARERAARVATVFILEQPVEVATPQMNSGLLVVQIMRPTYNFTCSGHLEPNMEESPTVQARLLSFPDDLPRHQVHAGTGTEFDFNIHVKSLEAGKLFPTGKYVFEYRAEVESVTGNDDGDSEI